jgi:hypothetical protein
MTPDNAEQAVLDAVLDGREILTLVFYDGKPEWGLVGKDEPISARTAERIIESALSQAHR